MGNEKMEKKERYNVDVDVLEKVKKAFRGLQYGGDYYQSPGQQGDGYRQN